MSYRQDLFEIDKPYYLPSSTNTSFSRKYGVDAAWAADFIIGGTDSADLIEAFETVEADIVFQAAVETEFGASYDRVFEDLTRSLRGGVRHFKETA